MSNIDIFSWLEFSANPDNQAMYGSFREMQEAFLRQQQGNDMAAPAPLANTEPDKSAQGTIEDKLNKPISKELYNLLMAAHEAGTLGHTLNTDVFLPKLQAIITTESTRLLDKANEGVNGALYAGLGREKYLEALQKEQHD